jgi:hypothetical protein
MPGPFGTAVGLGSGTPSGCAPAAPCGDRKRNRRPAYTGTTSYMPSPKMKPRSITLIFAFGQGGVFAVQVTGQVGQGVHGKRSGCKDRASLRPAPQPRPQRRPSRATTRQIDCAAQRGVEVVRSVHQRASCKRRSAGPVHAGANTACLEGNTWPLPPCKPHPFTIRPIAQCGHFTVGEWQFDLRLFRSKAPAHETDHYSAADRSRHPPPAPCFRTPRPCAPTTFS